MRPCLVSMTTRSSSTVLPHSVKKSAAFSLVKVGNSDATSRFTRSSTATSAGVFSVGEVDPCAGASGALGPPPHPTMAPNAKPQNQTLFMAQT